MREIIVLEFLTLDGVMQAPGGPEEDTSSDFKFGGWTVPYFDDFSGKAMDKQMQKPFSLLLGRITYEIFASYWPQHEDEWPGVNDATKYVVSKTISTSDWQNTVFINGEAVQKLKEIKKEDGPPLQVYGSGNLVQTLMKNDLVDEFWLKIFPVTLGTGKRLFEDGTIPLAFKLIDSKTSPSGVIFANYEREGTVKTGSF